VQLCSIWLLLLHETVLGNLLHEAEFRTSVIICCTLNLAKMILLIRKSNLFANTLKYSMLSFKFECKILS